MLELLRVELIIIAVTCDDEVEGLETFDMTLAVTSSATEVSLGRDTSKGKSLIVQVNEL